MSSDTGCPLKYSPLGNVLGLVLEWLGGIRPRCTAVGKKKRRLPASPCPMQEACTTLQHPRWTSHPPREQGAAFRLYGRGRWCVPHAAPATLIHLILLVTPRVPALQLGHGLCAVPCQTRCAISTTAPCASCSCYPRSSHGGNHLCATKTSILEALLTSGHSPLLIAFRESHFSASPPPISAHYLLSP